MNLYCIRDNWPSIATVREFRMEIEILLSPPDAFSSSSNLQLTFSHPLNPFLVFYHCWQIRRVGECRKFLELLCRIVVLSEENYIIFPPFPLL